MRDIILAERFPGLGGPWDVPDIEADRLLPYLEVLSIEAEAHADRVDMAPNERSFEFG